MPEISDQELRTLQGARDLLGTIYQSPEHGMAVKRAVKAARPDVPIPEIDVPAHFMGPIDERIGGLTKTVETLAETLANERAERQQQAEEDKLARAMAQARDRHKLTDEGVGQMVELMRNEGIANPQTAAELYVSRLPKASPVSNRSGSQYGGTSYANIHDQGSEEANKMLLEDPDRFLDMEVTKIMSEFENAA